MAPEEEFDATQAERRVDALGREAFDAAVAKAATAATQAVARVHRTRLVTQAGIAAFFVALAVLAPGGYLLYQNAKSDARNNALFNCQVVRQESGALADFVYSDARLRIEQARLSPPVTKAFARLLGAPLLARVEARSAHLNSEAVHYWNDSVVPRLRMLAGQNCEIKVK